MNALYKTKFSRRTYYLDPFYQRYTKLENLAWSHPTLSSTRSISAENVGLGSFCCGQVLLISINPDPVVLYFFSQNHITWLNVMLCLLVCLYFVDCLDCLYEGWMLCRGKMQVERNWSVQSKLLSNHPWLFIL